MIYINEYYFNFTVFMEFVKQKITGNIFLKNSGTIIANKLL